jgi:hypothetical protein
MRTRTVLLALAALLAALAIGPHTASAMRGMEVAVQDDLLFLHRGATAGQYMDRDTAFEKMRTLQGSALRVNVLWTHAVANDQEHLKRKPKHVRYDWAPYESLVELARGYGIRVQFSLTGPGPAWGTPTGEVARGHNRPKARLYAQFVRAVARRFEGRVQRYSLWNEPNWSSWLAPQKQAARRYRQLYQLGYRAIKREDRRADVLFGELVPYDSRHSIAPLEFLRKVACVNRRYKPTRLARRNRRASPRSGKRCAGGALKADGFAHHPYEFEKRPRLARRPTRDDVSLGSLGRLTRALDKLERSRALVPRGRAWLPLYLTEFGYFRAGERRIAERRRAKWAVEGFQLAQRHRRVKQLLYYVLVRPPGGTFFDLSLLDWDGGETRTYRALVRWATAAAMSGQIRRPGRKRAGVSDVNPPPSPAGPPPPPPPPGEPPPEEPPCEILPNVPCPVLVPALSG